jgi:hypothetical protein
MEKYLNCIRHDAIQPIPRKGKTSADLNSNPSKAEIKSVIQLFEHERKPLCTLFEAYTSLNDSGVSDHFLSISPKKEAIGAVNPVKQSSLLIRHDQPSLFSIESDPDLDISIIPKVGEMMSPVRNESNGEYDIIQTDQIQREPGANREARSRRIFLDFPEKFKLETLKTKEWQSCDALKFAKEFQVTPTLYTRQEVLDLFYSVEFPWHDSGPSVESKESKGPTPSTRVTLNFLKVSFLPISATGEIL